MDKWSTVFLIVLATASFSPVIVSEYQTSQCRIEAIKAGVEADKIKTACGIK